MLSIGMVRAPMDIYIYIGARSAHHHFRICKLKSLNIYLMEDGGLPDASGSAAYLEG
jgi:hypothetical protein